jgi:hypothetical protein
MNKSFVSPLWLSALIMLGGALFTFAPTVAEHSSGLTEFAIQRCAPQRAKVLSTQPEAAAALADAIWSNPDNAVCVLSAHSMTRNDLHTVMEEVASDPVLAERYAKARRVGRTL